MEILDAGQIATVLDALKGDRLYPIVVLAIATGMRRGELLALQWRDVDLDRGALRVERSLEQTRPGFASRGRNRNTESGRYHCRKARLTY